MSNIYNLEPVTKGKVLLHTSHGEVEVELWAREAPKACRNFVQLCMEGYYNNTIFHRLVQNFCIQGGDPTGTGTGGNSIYGADFADEFHQRLKFCRRGLVAMANSGKPHSNGSQFFITLGETPELQKKHTIFGKVSGNTIFNVLQMSELETDNEERPLEPPSIKKTEILNNPFDDIVPRVSQNSEETKDKKKGKKKSQMKATKNFKLLSFGEEAEEDEEQVQEVSSKLGKISSAHDKTEDPTLSREVAVSAAELEEKREERKNAAEKIREKLKKELEEAKRDATSVPVKNEDKVSSLKDEADKLLHEIKGIGKEEKPGKVKVERDEKLNDEEKQTVNQFRKQLNDFKKQLLEKKAKSKSQRENEALSLLAEFKKQKEASSKEDTVIPEDVEGEEEEDLLNNINLFSHSLVDAARTAKVKDANVLDDDTYEIYDPRHPINVRKRQKEGKDKNGEDKKWKRTKILT